MRPICVTDVFIPGEWTPPVSQRLDAFIVKSPEPCAGFIKTESEASFPAVVPAHSELITGQNKALTPLINEPEGFLLCGRITGPAAPPAAHSHYTTEWTASDIQPPHHHIKQ